MGTDKSLLNYHGKPQWQFLVELLETFVSKVYVSVRANQKIDYPYIIEDFEEGLGPFGAILSAFKKYPNAAFLVIAIDLPYIGVDTVKMLIENRDATKNATALQAKSKNYPEPLMTIWEPKSLYYLEKSYEKQIYKPIHVLKKMPIKRWIVKDDVVLNINTPQDYKFFNKKT